MKENYIFKPSELAIKILEMKPNYSMTFNNADKQVGALDFKEMKPNYSMTFNNADKQVGALDFKGPEMVFTGDADESAKVFFDWIAKWFKGRLEQERAEEREACAKLCDEYQNPFEGRAMADAIRARRNT